MLLFMVVMPVDHQVGSVWQVRFPVCGKFCGLALHFISERTYARVGLAVCMLVDPSLCRRDRFSHFQCSEPAWYGTIF